MWMKCCTQGLHNMVKAGILKISNGEMVQNWHDLFRVEAFSSFDKLEEENTIFCCSQSGYCQGNTEIWPREHRHTCTTHDAQVYS